MTLPIASRYIEAEVLAWPLWSESAFRACCLRLERTEAGVLTGATQQISEPLLQHLRLRSRGLSLEHLRQFQEHVWFGTESPAPLARARDLPLEDMLCQLATRRLVSYSGRFFVRDGVPALAHQVAEWRWVSLTLPPDLVIAAYTAGQGQPPPASDHVLPGSDHLSHFFDEEGVAQTHLHLGAAVPFELLWTNLMARIGSDELQPQGLAGPGEAPYGSGEGFLGWLVIAALARLSLASFLAHRERERFPRDDFRAFLSELASRHEATGPHLAALKALSEGRTPAPYAQTRRALRQLGALPPQRAPRELWELREMDPLYRWHRATEGALPETRLLHECLSWLRGPGRSSEDADSVKLFRQLFWQYVRIRNRTYRHLVQEPGTAGLDWFSTHFLRIRGVRPAMDTEVLMSSALQLESRGPTALASLEVRTWPPAFSVDVDKLVRQVADAKAPPNCAPERGLVLHFIKEHSAPQGSGQPHADPRSLAYGCRFGAYFRQCENQARAMERALARHPELLVVLRGLDVCNLELSVPTWVFAPIFQWMRESSEIASQTLSSRHGTPVPPFRFTMHVGEDYRRLVEGLRRIDEPLHFRLLVPGDRLGHAVAMGVDPARWAAAAPVARQPAEERLDDLLWELELYRHGRIPVDGGRLEKVRREVGELSRSIYGDFHAPEVLIEARALRFNVAWLRRLGYPVLGALERPVDRELSRAERLFELYLTDFQIYSRGQQPVEVAVDDKEVRMLRDAQRYLRDCVAQRAITVEANPASNVLVGDLPLEEHPVFALQPLPGMRGTEGGPVLVCLGDDDPITFASSLPDEYCHLYHALIRRGVASADALTWLDQVRRNGMRARFTVPRYSVAARDRERALSILHPRGTSPW